MHKNRQSEIQKLNHPISTFSCKLCSKNDHPTNFIIPCSCSSYVHPKCLLNYCNSKLKHKKKSINNNQLPNTIMTCKVCFNKLCV